MTTRLHAKIGTFRQLEILLAVYELGSVTLASEELHLTQPTVSMQLKKLADMVGVTLYDQVGKRLIFTEAGELMVQAARDTLERVNDLDMALSELRGLKTGTLKLAVVTTAKYFIPHLLGPFCRKYPNIDVEFNVGNRQQIIQRLQRGHDDFYVFSHIPSKLDIETIDFLDNPLVAIAAEDHPLAQERQVSLKQLAQAPFLMRERGSGTRFTIERFLRKQDLRLNVRMTIESNEAIKHAVMAGLGISILSQHTLAFGESAGVVELQVPEMPIRSKWFLLKLKAKSLSPIARTFLEFIESEGRDSLLHELYGA
jgi:DNA-binding transcriptional LysR family regulator|tara:strand:+ start:4199 stop:5134 length:936 start_codon:yes stop_codon:yes gene_type:complete